MRILPFGAAVLLVVCQRAAAAQIVRRSSANSGGRIQQVSDPESWLGRLGELPNGRRLWLGSEWENVTDRPMAVLVNYRPYLADGRALIGCSGGETVIMPGERAWLVCDAGIADDQMALPKIVTARLGHAYAASDTVRGGVVDSVVSNDGALGREHHRDDYPPPTAFAHAARGDIGVTPAFRLYDAKGIQLGTCSAWSVVLQHEVSQRFTAMACPARDALRGDVTRIAVSFTRE